MTSVEKAAYAKRMDDARRQREAEILERNAKARKEAAKQWQAAKPVSADHPYLINKGISPHGVKVGKDNRLVVPVRNSAGKIQSLQFITADGDKLFLSGGAIQGHYFSIGKPNGSVLICEGFATGASLLEATGHAVAVAFNAGNILPVAKTIKNKYPNLKIIICGDNDMNTEGNPGVTKATAAAKSIGASLAVPQFKDASGNPTDFNDLASAEGLDAVRDQVESAKPRKGTLENKVTKPADSTIDELNKKHAIVMVGGKCVVMNNIINHTTGNKDITFSAIPDFNYRYSNQTITVNEKPMSIAKYWLHSSQRRQYDGIVFEPQRDIPNQYNLWQGFSIAPKYGDWSLMEDHLEEVICGGNTDYYKWLRAWLARIVQSPGGEKPGTAIVMRGMQGTGKGCFVSNFGMIFGQHFRHLTNQKHLTGNFNAHLKDTIVVFVDEGFWAGDKSAEGVLKGLVTEKIILMESKGKDAIHIKNHMNFLLASNSDWVVPAGLNERRFAVFDVSDKKAGDRTYFNELFDQMNNGGREAMLYDLLNLDIIVDLRKIPRTEALLDQILETMDSVQAFWYSCLDNGVILNDEIMWPSHTTKKAVYARYLEHCQERKVRHPIGDARFSKILKKHCPGLTDYTPRDGKCRLNCHKIPYLADCREAFEKIIQMKIDWTKEEED